MKNVCVNCWVLVTDDKRFCSRCGKPLALATEVEAKLRRDVDAAPGKVNSIEQLINLLAADQARGAELTELRVRRCEVLVAGHPSEEELDAIRDAFGRIAIELLPPAALGRAAACFARLHADDPGSEKLFEVAGVFSRATQGLLTGEGRTTWVAACLGWGDVLKNSHRRRARAFYEYASTAEPDNPEVGLRLAQCRKLDQRTRIRTLAISSIGIVLAVGAVFTVRHFTTSELLVTLPTTFRDVYIIAIDDDNHRLLTLKPKGPGIFRVEAIPGQYSVRVFQSGLVLWDSTVTLAGGNRAVVALPGLMENGPLGERPLGEATFSKFRAESDPLNEYVTFVWSHEGKSFNRLPRLELQVPSGIAQVVGFTTVEPANSMYPKSAWFLRTPEGDTFFLKDLTGGVKSQVTVTRDGRPALLIKTGAPHDVGGFDASTWIFHDGQTYQYHSVTQFYGDDVSPPPDTADGALRMSLFRDLGKMHARPAPGSEVATSPSAGEASAPTEPRSLSSAATERAVADERTKQTSAEENAEVTAEMREQLAQYEQQMQEESAAIRLALPGKWYFDGSPANNKRACPGGYIEVETVSPIGALTGAFVCPEEVRRFTGNLNAAQVEFVIWVPVNDRRPNGEQKRRMYSGTVGANHIYYGQAYDIEKGGWRLQSGWSATKR